MIAFTAMLLGVGLGILIGLWLVDSGHVYVNEYNAWAVRWKVKAKK